MPVYILMGVYWIIVAILSKHNGPVTQRYRATERVFMLAEHPYTGYKLYKVYHKKEGRFYAVLFKNKKERTTVSWARYIMSVHLGRLLDPKKETVDHIDGNKTNSIISNLQLLPLRDNIKKSSKGRTYVKLICPVCNKEFTREKKNTHLTKSRMCKGKTCCSRSCGSIYSHYSDAIKCK